VESIKLDNHLPILQNQVRRLEVCAQNLENQSNQWSRWRLLSFLLLLILGAAVFLTWGPVPWAITIIILVFPFIFSIWRHRQVEARLIRCLVWLKLKHEQMARLLLDWENIPLRYQAELPPDHPFALDLDLVGSRSILQLFDRSNTEEGSARLQQWLLDPNPDPQAIIGRQKLVKELIQLPAFADRLALHALLARDEIITRLKSQKAKNNDSPAWVTQWSGKRLLQWVEIKSKTESLRPVLIILLLMTPLNLILLALFIAGQLPPLFIATWFMYGVVTVSQNRKLEPMFRDAAFLSENLRQLSALFGFLENRPFPNQPELAKFCAPIRESGKRPSVQLKRVNRLFAAVGLRYNPFVALLLNALVPWDIFFAYRLDKFKEEMAGLMPNWIDLLSDLEALTSLAGITTLYPQVAFPQILSLPAPNQARPGGDSQLHAEKQAPFCAYGITHPLISVEKSVANDFVFDQLGSIAMITGSNMAGKSSFLRTLGVNIRLAMCGAPVLARKMRLVPWRIVASITITDSVIDGFSFFYAEVRRLKDLVDELNAQAPYPLFFLIDEIFRGTNNRERLIGSRSYVRNLVGHFGAGAIATHDLELVQLADDLPEIRNFHFRDAVEDGRMVFDYRIHPGPCPTTNALKIMRMAGLPVEIPEDSG
jgi:hypothetical protein